MKCNVKELAVLSDAPCVIEGRLNYKKTSTGSIREGVFKERWFRLVKNYLFYFRLSEMGKFDARCPAGVFVLENSAMQVEHGQTIPFTFSISFLEETDKRHVLGARSQDAAAAWLVALRQCSYEYLRSQMYALQAKIFAISGYDPLLLVPRNEGAKLWAPSVPFSTAPACTTSAGFSCHLHSKGHTHPTFTLDRSHSDALLAHKHCLNLTSHTHTHTSHVHKHTVHKYTHTRSKLDKDEGLLISLSPTKAEPSENETKVNEGMSSFNLEKSATTSILPNELTNSIFDSEVLYTRPAPSPPVRKRSPRPQRVQMMNADSLLELSRSLATTSILEAGPSAPPRRKISLREMSGPAHTPLTSNNDAEDLIKF